jgi:hypothetical protein
MEDAGCPHDICPHIMENLNDLRRDPAFVDAVDDDMLISPLAPTLRYLRDAGFPDELPKRDEPIRKRYNHGVKPECAACPFPRAGLFCHGADGSCVKTDFNAVLTRGRKPCPA